MISIEENYSVTIYFYEYNVCGELHRFRAFKIPTYS